MSTQMHDQDQHNPDEEQGQHDPVPTLLLDCVAVVLAGVLAGLVMQSIVPDPESVLDSGLHLLVLALIWALPLALAASLAVRSDRELGPDTRIRRRDALLFYVAPAMIVPFLAFMVAGAQAMS